MTIHYPDISAYEAGISLTGMPLVCVKATEGTTWTNSDYQRVVHDAQALGTPLFAYHFLRPGNGAGQADHYWSIAGPVPCMVDFEPEFGSTPTLADLRAFRNRLRALGGNPRLLYFPRWVWSQIGEPSLTEFNDMLLVSSNYPSAGYTDNGPGWIGYGGLIPTIWQWTSSQYWGHTGYKVDMNAFKGTVDQLAGLIGISGTSSTPTPHPSGDPVMAALPTVQNGSKGDTVKVVQQLLNLRGAHLVVDGDDGPLTTTAVEDFQSRQHITRDGICGQHTWSELLLLRDVA